MADRTLHHCRILVVEDEYMLAEELKDELSDEGAAVLGPVGTVEEATALIAAEAAIDGAILDVNLGGEMVFAAADMLADRSVPFVFTTGYDESVIPARFTGVVRCGKPVNIAMVTQAIGRIVQTC